MNTFKSKYAPGDLIKLKDGRLVKVDSVVFFINKDNKNDSYYRYYDTKDYEYHEFEDDEIKCKMVEET